MDRRQALGFLGAACAAARAARARAGFGASRAPIPSTGERVPVVGLGTWITFDVGAAESPARRARGEILRAFLAAGGRLVDSSPMYGSSEAVIGAELARVRRPAALLRDQGLDRGQRCRAAARWSTRAASGALRALRPHAGPQPARLADALADAARMKADGRVRYIGMTTSHGRRHDDLEEILKRERLDFVQLTYNLNDREVESRLLPLAAERGVAVIVNRPFDGGSHLRREDRASRFPGGRPRSAAAAGPRPSSSGSRRTRR